MDDPAIMKAVLSKINELGGDPNKRNRRFYENVLNNNELQKLETRYNNVDKLEPTEGEADDPRLQRDLTDGIDKLFFPSTDNDETKILDDDRRVTFEETKGDIDIDIEEKKDDINSGNEEEVSEEDKHDDVDEDDKDNEDEVIEDRRRQTRRAPRLNYKHLHTKGK